MKREMTISQRVVGGSAVLIILTLGLGLYAYQRLEHVNTASRVVTGESLPTIIVANEIRSLVKENMVNTYQHALTSIDDTARFSQIEQEMKEGSARITGHYKELESLLKAKADHDAMADILKARGEYTGKRGELLKLSRELTAAQMEALLREQLLPRYRAYIGAIEKFVAQKDSEGRESGDEVDATVQNGERLIMAGSIAAIVLGIAASLFSVRAIARALRAVGSQLAESSAKVASAATQVNSSSQSLAGGASEQAASLEETSASLEEISSMTKRNAESASEANSFANQTRTAAETGATDVEAMNDAMEAIKSSSDNIAKIIKTIDQIAFQTNILALNAAVEAARAGEAGAGFAVVADEVRALAQRSAQAARETADKIEDAIQKSARGVEISAKVAGSLRQIVEKARSVDTLVGEISTASREQSDGIGQVLTAVTQMDKVTQGNAALAEESAAAAEELTAQARSLDEIVGQLQRLTGSTSHTTGKVAVAVKKPAVKAAPVASVRPTVGHSSFAKATENKKVRPTTPAPAPKVVKAPSIVTKPAPAPAKNTTPAHRAEAAPALAGAISDDPSLDQFFK
jgi:methyl-accepting chemotaxis protein